MAIKTYQLSNAIYKRLETYSREVVDGMNAVGEQVTSEGLAALKSSSPRQTGAYAKGWRLSKSTFYLAPTRFVLHNATRYRLTHLLEHGHATRSGGRTQARPHVGPVEAKVVESYTAGAERVIRGGP